MEQLWKVLLWSRLAESVRVRLKPFCADDFGSLEQGLSRLPWHAYLRPKDTVELRVTCRKSRLYHTGAVAERTLRVIGSQLGSRGEAAEPTGAARPLAYVRIERDRVQVSIDGAGERLHRRGYRTHVGTAPLRETLAAALVCAAREAWRERDGGATPSVVWDPFCGSGTISIEWVLRALNVPAGIGRSFAFERWPIHDAKAYDEWLRRQVGRAHADAPAMAYGSDAGARVLRAAAHNASAAGVASHCTWLEGDFQDIEAQIPHGSCIVSNPPYGVRLGSRDLADVYARFDSLLERRRDLRPVVLVCGFLPYLSQTRLVWQELGRIKIGGLPAAIILLG